MEENTSAPLLVMPEKVYNFLKVLAVVILPGIGALYFGLADIWNLPKPTEVVGTITVVDAFLGLLIQAAARAYNNSDAKYDGVIVGADNPETYAIQADMTPEELAAKKQVVLKVEGS